MSSEDPPGSRLFVVCGNACEEELLRESFSSFGSVEYAKRIKDKGVAYVKMDKASSAALAMEALHETALNNGRGPRIRVLLADPSSAGTSNPSRPTQGQGRFHDPDNTPPRSRLFFVVPKQADPNLIENELRRFPDVQYCKTDMVATKGIVYLKFDKASSALSACEEVNQTEMICGFKVKCMLATPREPRPEVSPEPLSQPARLEASQLNSEALKVINELMQQGVSHQIIASVVQSGGLSPSHNNFNSPNQFQNRMLGMSNTHSMPSSPYMGSSASPDPNRGSPPPFEVLCTKRLYVVVNKAVTSDEISRLFKRYPGMEFCDLKKDDNTGKSKGFCYVNYSRAEMASSALRDLHLSEFPPHSGHRIKVMFAEQLGPKPHVTPASTRPMTSYAMNGYEPMSVPPITPTGMAGLSVQSLGNLTSSLSHLSMSRVASHNDFRSNSPSLMHVSSAGPTPLHCIMSLQPHNVSFLDPTSTSLGTSIEILGC
eukprot:gene17134-23438_t